jgi:hypothetical protein
MYHHLYHGGGRTPFDTLFPQNLAGWKNSPCNDCPVTVDAFDELTPQVLDLVQVEAAGHKVHVAYGLSRTLDFFPNDVDTSYDLQGDCVIPNDGSGRFQAGLQQYLSCHPIRAGDTLYPIIIPPNCEFYALYWAVEAPEDGIVMVLSDVRGQIGNTTIDCSVKATGWEPVNEWLHYADALRLQVQSGSSAPLNKLRLTVSAVVFHPDTGN